MTDRLRDLKRGGQTSISIDGQAGAVSTAPRAGLLANDVEAAQNSASAPQSASLQFFSDVDMLKKNIASVKEATGRLADLTQETVLATSNEKENELSDQVTPIISAANKTGVFTKKLLQGLKEETSRSGLQAQDLKIRENLLNVRVLPLLLMSASASASVYFSLCMLVSLVLTSP